MTTPTKEQADAALDHLQQEMSWVFEEDTGLDAGQVVADYIAHLEANQRQEVTDEKLREAVSYFTPHPRTVGSVGLTPELMRQHVATIEAALSELAELRAKQQWLPIETAPTGVSILVYYDNCEVQAIEAVENFGDWQAYVGKHKNPCVYTPRYWQPFPTTPAEGGE